MEGRDKEVKELEFIQVPPKSIEKCENPLEKRQKLGNTPRPKQKHDEFLTGRDALLCPGFPVDVLCAFAMCFMPALYCCQMSGIPPRSSLRPTPILLTVGSFAPPFLCVSCRSL